MPTLTIQPSDIDTILIEGTPNTNYGSITSLSVVSKATNLDRRSILKFDFSALPAGVAIQSAMLSLYYYSNGVFLSPAGRSYWAYELTQTAWTELGATWNKYDGTNNWASAGGDYVTDNGAPVAMPGSFGWVNWNVLALAQHFQSQHAEVAHFLIRDPFEEEPDGRGALFYSNNYTTDLSLRPKLVIVYSQTYEESLTLSGSGGISEAKEIMLNPSLSLPINTGISEVREMTLNPSLSLPANGGIQEVGQANLLRLLSLPASGGIQNLGGFVYDNFLDLENCAGILEEYSTGYGESLALESSAGIFEKVSSEKFVSLLLSSQAALLAKIMGLLGTYYFAAGLDFGSPQRIRLSTEISILTVNELDLIDDREAPIDEWLSFDGEAAGQGDCRIYVRKTNDDPNVSPVWSNWELLDSGEFNSRAYQFKIRLSVIDSNYNVYVGELIVHAEEDLTIGAEA